MTLTCLRCGVPSETLLICEDCRPELTAFELKKYTILWHDIIVARSYDPKRDQYQCFHCEDWFSRNRVCGDHFPDTKAAKPEIRFDILAGVCSCMEDNTSGARKRKKPGFKKICSKCRVLLAGPDGLCFKCR